MIFAQFSSSVPYGTWFNPSNMAFANYWLGPMQAGMAMQYQFLNTLTWGLLDDISAEVEHALVEGRDLSQVLATQIQALQGAALSQEQKQLLARTRLLEAEENLHEIIQNLTLNLMQLPFTRLAGKPARKRFAITLEGEVVEGEVVD
ncbi:hypothetical protein [Halioxenophilus aromaticivorans]|uniref:Uncharacterized protein n=1 Tax=Halioxenophilus aromaticivorans TaxID=1306992 RepID=A0AAV3U0U3_9ALTE